MGKPLRVLIVEDSEDDAELILRELRSGDYEPRYLRVQTAKDMDEALSKRKWDIIISDYSMPNFNGLSALELLKRKELDLPFIIVSGAIGEDVAVAAMKAGAHDYIMKNNLSRLVPVIQRELREAEERRKRKLAEEERKRMMEKLKKAMVEIIHAMALLVETRDPYTAGHQRRVAELASNIAKEMALPQKQIDAIIMAGSIHDIGKTYIPGEILSKPRRLTENEFGMIKTHPQVGYEILKGIDFPWPVARIVLQHHERLDGSGYPNGLRGNEIILEARIIAIADVVEAMASHRPYRPALGIDRALEEIERGAGVKYDPEAAEACLKLFREKNLQLLDSSKVSEEAFAI